MTSILDRKINKLTQELAELTKRKVLVDKWPKRFTIDIENVEDWIDWDNIIEVTSWDDEENEDKWDKVSEQLEDIKMVFELDSDASVKIVEINGRKVDEEQA